MFANVGNFYMETKLAQRKAMEAALPIIKAIGEEWAAISGRPFDVVKSYGTEDADRVIVVMGSSTGNVRHVVKQLREKGEKVGVVSVRVFRPFPATDLVNALRGAKAIAVMDRCDSMGGQGGPLWQETAAALQSAGVSTPTRAYMYGLGGADVTSQLIEEIFEDLKTLDADKAAGKVPDVTYKGNR